ncbi:hypothetical protein MSAN_01320900 [Mycena sanguinolenta]|uniref:Uncharacterized protein n=1 Tax=Mycena sanguinolenta TaxID=230812 RepID=A0A8H6YDP5_9AGAR|nr:hypothetical protein MSAN_01320900 [Mycena sanguinolenta]
MFSKVLAFGLGALALVRAAPAFSFQTPMLSCDINLPTTVGTAQSFDALEPGTYSIYNEAFGQNQLRSYRTGDAIYVSRTLEFPGPFGMWRVETSGNPAANEYTITNVGLNAGTSATFAGEIATQPGKGNSFAIEPAGEGLYVIKVPNEDKVWTVDTQTARSSVYLKGQDGVATAWKFVPFQV